MPLPVPCLTLVALAATLASAPALATPVQVSVPTGNANSFAASVSDDGNRIAFYSANNLTGGNGDRSFEIFLYDRPTNTLTQVSSFGGGSLVGGNQVPSISGDGNKLAYQHFETLPNGSNIMQSVLYDHVTKTSVTVTAPALFSETNELSRDGKTMAIATGNTGLRLYDTASGVMGPVIAGNTFNTAMSRDGSRIAMEFIGQLVVQDLKTHTTLNITGTGAGFNLRPDFSDDGTKLAFTSTYDPLGTNADRNSEVFLYDLTTNTVRQLTFSTGDAFSNADVSMSADGKRIAFSSTRNLTGHNADGNQEIFLYDLVDDVLRQVTDTGPSDYNLEAAISGDGLTLAFTSSANFGGSNNSHVPQIYFETLAPSQAVPEPSTLLLLAAAGFGLLAARRRRQPAALGLGSPDEDHDPRCRRHRHHRGVLPGEGRP